MKLKIGILVLALILFMGFYTGYAIFGISSIPGSAKTINVISVGPVVATFQCNDGMDNDNDTYIDFPADPGCTSLKDNSEYNEDNNTNQTYQCSDFIDNDNDTYIDFPADPGCYGPTDDDEWNNGTNQTCGNGILEPPEECDDGNLINRDGCDQYCHIENGTNKSTEDNTLPKKEASISKDKIGDVITGITLIQENNQFKLSISSRGTRESPVILTFYEKDAFARKLVEEISIEDFNFGKGLNEYYLTLRGLSSARGFFDGADAEIIVEITIQSGEVLERFQSKVHKILW